MSRSRARLAADWFAKLRQNAVTNEVEHTDVVDVAVAEASSVQSNDSPTFGTVTATSFVGDGSNLTGVGASTTFGAVGTYVWAATYTYSNTQYLPNATIAASLLYVAGLGIDRTPQSDLPSGTYASYSTIAAWTSTTALSGTWRAMGYSTSSTSSLSSGRRTGMTLWVRIA